MLTSISGRSVVVTGASKGIGKGIARVFASQGARVLVVARTLADAEATAAELGNGASAFSADVGDWEQCQAMAAAAAERHGGIDVLCANAGVFPQTDAIPAGAQLPTLLPGTRLHLGFLIGVLIAVALWLYLTRTPGGFRIRAVGASVRAAEVSGRFRPDPVIWRAFLVSGAIAGLAGWIQVAGITHRMYEGLSPGWGYTAIAVALLARLNPLAVVLTAIVFGALSAGGGAMQREAGVPDVWVRGIEALVILAVLTVDRGLQAFAGRSARGETPRRTESGKATGAA